MPIHVISVHSIWTNLFGKQERQRLTTPRKLEETPAAAAAVVVAVAEVILTTGAR
jgi:hypothetical protein